MQHTRGVATVWSKREMRWRFEGRRGTVYLPEGLRTNRRSMHAGSNYRNCQRNYCPTRPQIRHRRYIKLKNDTNKRTMLFSLTDLFFGRLLHKFIFASIPRDFIENFPWEISSYSLNIRLPGDTVTLIYFSYADTIKLIINRNAYKRGNCSALRRRWN